MRLFVDANILIAVLNHEYPLFDTAAKVLSLSDRKEVDVFTSPVCISIAFYFSAKKSGEEVAKSKIALMLKHIGLTTVDSQSTLKAVADKRVHDLEDGIQYYSAVYEKCDYLITENTADFYFSDMPIMTSSSFLKEVFKAH